MKNLIPTENELDEALINAQENEFKKSFEKGEDRGSAIHAISKHLIQQYHTKTIKGARREIYVYSEGLYIPGEEILKKAIRELLEEICTTHILKEILETIKDYTPIDRASFTVEKNLINLSNGILNIRTKELIPHSPDYLFLTKIPVAYNPEASCPVIETYLSETLDEWQMVIVQEWAGYLLYRDYSIKKALICVGEGDTGKSTFLNLLDAFIGRENISGVSLQKMSGDKFALANLYQKHLNMYDDLSINDVKDNGAFKIATGNGVATGEKKFGNQFQFNNFAKLTFACNKIPDVKEVHDEAYFNRWIVLKFQHVVEEDKKDNQLLAKMTTAEELSGFLNLALRGLACVLQKQAFTYEKDVSEIKEEMMRSSSSIAQFSFDCLEEVVEEWVAKEEMFSIFTRYAHTNKLPAVSMKSFGSKLPLCAPYIAEFRPMDPSTGKQLKGGAWRNVRIKDEWKDAVADASEENSPSTIPLTS